MEDKELRFYEAIKTISSLNGETEAIKILTDCLNDKTKCYQYKYLNFKATVKAIEKINAHRIKGEVISAICEEVE